jgi:hypothetical protein
MKGSSCSVARRTTARRSAGHCQLKSGPAPSCRSRLAIAIPRTDVGTGLASTVSISRTSGSAAASRRRHNGARALRPLGAADRASTMSRSQLWTIRLRDSGETSCCARDANNRLHSGGRPAASWRSRENASSRAPARIHGRSGATRYRSGSCGSLIRSIIHSLLPGPPGWRAAGVPHLAGEVLPRRRTGQ